jgi:hypothetical protein
VLQHPYWTYLLEVALYSLEKADKLFRRSRQAELATEESADYLLGDKIPVHALTLACSLVLSFSKLPKTPTSRTKQYDRLTQLVGRWTGIRAEAESCAEAFGSGFAKEAPDLLKESLVRHSYPMINRLHALKVLVDHTVLSDAGECSEKEREEILRWTKELLQLKSRLDAPMHFTPLHLGTTAALVYLRCRTEAEESWTTLPNDSSLSKLRRTAERELSVSEEMYTMRRSYYEAISSLYYLYEDFNDRFLHFNQAVQMAGAEFASLLRYLMARPDFLRPGVLPEPPSHSGEQGNKVEKY